MEPLKQPEIDILYRKLSEKQKYFIDEYVKKGKKSKWLQVMAEMKGIVLTGDEDFERLYEQIDDWVLEDVLDGGYGNLPYHCECGQALRFQYIVTHRSKGLRYKLGVTCFENYTKLSPRIIREIKKKMNEINFERDELLIKIDQGFPLDLSKYTIKGIEVPEKYLLHIKHDVPLLDKQIARLERELQNLKEKEWAAINRKRYQEEEEREQRKREYWQKQKQETQNALEFHKTRPINKGNSMYEYIETMKWCQENEMKIDREYFRKEWAEIKTMFSDYKDGKPFDYSIFSTKLSNFVYYLSSRAD